MLWSHYCLCLFAQGIIKNTETQIRKVKQWRKALAALQNWRKKRWASFFQLSFSFSRYLSKSITLVCFTTTSWQEFCWFCCCCCCCQCGLVVSFNWLAAFIIKEWTLAASIWPSAVLSTVTVIFGERGEIFFKTVKCRNLSSSSPSSGVPCYSFSHLSTFFWSCCFGFVLCAALLRRVDSFFHWTPLSPFCLVRPFWRVACSA